MREKHAIYMVDSSRINVAGLSTSNIPAVAQALRSVNPLSSQSPQQAIPRPGPPQEAGGWQTYPVCTEQNKKQQGPGCDPARQLVTLC